MRKMIACGLALATVAAPSAATAAKPDKAKDKDKPKATQCEPKAVGYNARGTFVSGSLTQTAGADTDKRGDDRYSGEIVVDVTKANHKSLTGEQTVTLTDARVRFKPRTDTTPTAGDRVKLKGKVTKLRKKCDSTGFTPTLTARRAHFKAPKA